MAINKGDQEQLIRLFLFQNTISIKAVDPASSTSLVLTGV